jgi:hypothetical protein
MHVSPLQRRSAVKKRLLILSSFVALNCSSTFCAVSTLRITDSTAPITGVSISLKSPAHEYPPGAIINRPERNEPNWFPHLMSIFANVGIIFLDPKNILHVKQQLAKLLDNIQALVHEITKRSYTSQEREIVIDQLAAQFQLLANELPQPIFIKK